MSVAIVISYRPGDPQMLNICLDAIERHTKVDYHVFIAVDGEKVDFDAWQKRTNITYEFHKPSRELKGSARHGDLLNVVTSRVRVQNFHHWILTLDYDCFPIADAWICDLLMMHGEKVGCSGILHPWKPPPPELSDKTIEYRVRNGWNWGNTHVACQLTTLDYGRINRLDYRDGGDTGLAFPKNAHDKCLEVKGFMPSMCPMPDDDFNPEFNRDVCVVFGDKVFHLGGGSRDKESLIWPAQSFHRSRERVRSEGHARWILDEGYRYKFDKEEKVVEAKMQVMHALMRQYLENNESLF